MSENLPESTELQREMADIRIREKLGLILRTRNRLIECDERWIRMEEKADTHFNLGQMDLGRVLAQEAYGLRGESRTLRRDLNEMYQELARMQAFLV